MHRYNPVNFSFHINSLLNCNFSGKSTRKIPLSSILLHLKKNVWKAFRLQGEACLRNFSSSQSKDWSISHSFRAGENLREYGFQLCQSAQGNTPLRSRGMCPRALDENVDLIFYFATLFCPSTFSSLFAKPSEFAAEASNWVSYFGSLSVFARNRLQKPHSLEKS